MVTPFGRAAASHVQVSSPAEGESGVPLPPGYRVLSEHGGRGTIDEPFYSRFHVDHGVLVEPQCFPSGERWFRASRGSVSEHGRLLGADQTGEPPLLASAKVSS